MKKFISNFHFITQDNSERSHADQTRIACEAGVNWIQYRCFSKTDQEMISELHEVASICDDWGATLILTDHIHLLDLVDAQGVHIEDMDADHKAIKETIGEERTLGASANSMGDIVRINDSESVDYIGCGPYAHSKTKPNNYSLLGLSGYSAIIAEQEKLHIHVPIIAVGGIQLSDLKDLLSTGIHGIALSGAIVHSSDPIKELKNFYQTLIEQRS